MRYHQKELFLWGLWLSWIYFLVSYALPYAEYLIFCLRIITCTYLVVILSTFVKRMNAGMFNFNKKEKNQSFKDTSTLVHQTENLTLPEQVNEENSGKETIISSGSLLTGQIINESTITINGQIEGEIVSKKTVQIGKEGKVHGKVSSLKLTINGLIKGSCYAKAVTILSRGRVEGDIYAEEFSIERGGIFIGQSHVIEEKNKIAEKEPLKVKGKQEISEGILKRLDDITDHEPLKVKAKQEISEVIPNTAEKARAEKTAK